MGKKEEQEMHRDERIEQTGQLTLTDNKEEDVYKRQLKLVLGKAKAL